jgi:uncharacterized protein YkwD
MKKYKNYLFILLIFITISTLGYSVTSGSSTSGDDKSGYLSDLEREVVEELNLARTHPDKYAGYLTAYSKLFVGKELREPGEITIMTEEGRSAVTEAISFLKKQKSLSLLTASPGMSKAASDMVRMQETTSQTGHVGKDGSKFSDRLSRYGTWGGSCGENIDYGNNTARKIVMSLIVDDGVSNRGHRTSIFTPGFRRVGVACGVHQKFRYMCVIEYAGSYSEK